MSRKTQFCGWVPFSSLGPVPFFTPCASCTSAIVVKPEHSGEIHLAGCDCVMPPLVCESCRIKNEGKMIQCKFCLRQGTALAYMRKKFLDPSFTRDWARTWFVFRRNYKDVKCPLFQMILNNWNLSYYFYRPIWIIPHDKLSPLLNESILKKMFFESWLQAKLFEKRGKISICYDSSWVNSHFLRMFGNVSFARIVIRNLFGRCPQTKQFQRMMAAIHARILANFKTIFEISLELK
jgi:hypothetical protein